MSVESNFVRKYETYLIKLKAELLRLQPHVIIGVARKAPRLAEMCAKYGMDFLPPGTPFISNKALSYIPKHFFSGKTVVVLDDSIVWGSTIYDVCTNPKLSDSAVYPVVLAASRNHNRDKFNGLTAIMTLPYADMMSFSCELVDSFKLLAKPYDLAHPIFESRINTQDFQRISDCKKFLINEFSAALFDLTYPDVNSESCNWVVYDPAPREKFIASNSMPSSTPTKFRLFIDMKKGLLRIQPIILFPAPQDSLLEQSSFLPEPLAGWYADIRRTLVCDNDIHKEDLLKALYSAQLFLAEIYAGLSFLSSVRVSDINLLQGPFELSRYDTTLIFGIDLAASMTQIGAIKSFSGSIDKLLVSPSSNHDHTDEFVEQYKTSKSFLEEHLNPDGNLTDNLATIVQSLRPLDDSTRTEQHIRGRLDFGYSFWEIESILKMYRIGFKRWALSASIDFLVDAGVVVPLTKCSRSGIIERVFRFGESRNKLQRLRYVIRTAAENLLKHQSRMSKRAVVRLPHVYTNKALVFAVLVGQQTAILPTSELGIKINFAAYGADLTFDDVLSDGRILPWALSERILIETDDGLELCPSFNRRYRHDENPLTPSQRVFIDTCMGWFADASIEMRDSRNRYEMALAVTTCNSASNTLRAIEAELRLWMHDYSSNANACLHKLDDLIELAKNGKKPEPRIIAKIAANVDKMLRVGPANFANQIKLKLSVFSRLITIRQALRDIYTRQDKTLLRSTYDNYVDPLLDPELSFSESHSVQLYGLFGRFCQSWTTVLRKCVLLVTAAEDEIAKAVDELAGAIQKTNDCVDDFKAFSPKYKLKSRLKLKLEGDHIERIDQLDILTGSLRNILYDYEDLLCNTIFVSNGTELHPIDKDVCLIKFDWINSSALDEFEMMSKGKRINDRIVKFIRDRLNETDIVAAAPDSNEFIIQEIGNIESGLHSLIDALAAEGLSARIGMHHTGRGGHRLWKDKENNIQGGRAALITARLRDQFRGDDKLIDGHSHIFVDSNTKDILVSNGIALACFVKWTEQPVELRGAEITVDIYEYRIT